MLFAWRKTMKPWRTFGEHRPWTSEVKWIYSSLALTQTLNFWSERSWAELGIWTYIKFDIVSPTHSSQRWHTAHHILNRFKTRFFSTCGDRKSLLGRQHQALALGVALLVPISLEQEKKRVVVSLAWVDGIRDLGKHPRNISVRSTSQWFSGVDSVIHPLLSPGVCPKS